MRVLVTGGAGFIGSNFVRLASEGHFPKFKKIVVLDSLSYAGRISNLPPQSKGSDYEFIQGDIRDLDVVKSAMKSVDTVINFAAESHVDRSISSRSEFITTNVVGVQVLLDAALAAGINCFLQVSTDEVYGSLIEGSATESHMLLPNSPYAASKAAADLIVRSYVETFDMDIKVTRSSNNYGPYQNIEKLIPNFITRLISDEKLPIYGDGKNIRNWIHVRDNCRLIYEVLVSVASKGIYNIAGRNELTNIEITDLLLKNFKVGPEVKTYVADRLGHDFRYSVNDSKLQTLIPEYSYIAFEAGIEETIEWYKSNKNWWRK
jgi:dTDP-glucose 4,6-dehydratase